MQKAESRPVWTDSEWMTDGECLCGVQRQRRRAARSARPRARRTQLTCVTTWDTSVAAASRSLTCSSRRTRSACACSARPSCCMLHVGSINWCLFRFRVHNCYLLLSLSLKCFSFSLSLHSSLFTLHSNSMPHTPYVLLILRKGEFYFWLCMERGYALLSYSVFIWDMNGDLVSVLSSVKVQGFWIPSLLFILHSIFTRMSFNP